MFILKREKTRDFTIYKYEEMIKKRNLKEIVPMLTAIISEATAPVFTF
jgi:hypothetical protein